MKTATCLARLVGTVILGLTLTVEAGVQKLSEICDRLEKYNDQRSYLSGTKLCRQIGGPDNQMVSDEEDYLTQEKYLHLRANLCQSLADEQNTAEHRKTIGAEALQTWEDYFEWIKNLPTPTRKELMNSKGTANGRKILAAAAAIGATAVAAAKPEEAWLDYEEVLDDNGWLGPDAFNWWLATLIFPEVPQKVNDKIFSTISHDKTKLAALVAKTERTAHWKAFADRLEQVVNDGRLGKAHQKLLDVLKGMLGQSSASSPAP